LTRANLLRSASRSITSGAASDSAQAFPGQLTVLLVVREPGDQDACDNDDHGPAKSANREAEGDVAAGTAADPVQDPVQRRSDSLLGQTATQVTLEV
jgi:hypothetical protein